MDCVALTLDVPGKAVGKMRYNGLRDGRDGRGGRGCLERQIKGPKINTYLTKNNCYTYLQVEHVTDYFHSNLKHWWLFSCTCDRL